MAAKELTPEAKRTVERRHEIYKFLYEQGGDKWSEETASQFDGLLDKLIFVVYLNSLYTERRRVEAIIKNAGDAHLSEDERFLQIVCRVAFPYEKGEISDSERDYIRQLYGTGVGVNSLQRITSRDKGTIMKICHLPPTADERIQ